jgi:hypothetical protein
MAESKYAAGYVDFDDLCVDPFRRAFNLVDISKSTFDESVDALEKKVIDSLWAIETGTGRRVLFYLVRTTYIFRSETEDQKNHYSGEPKLGESNGSFVVAFQNKSNKLRTLAAFSEVLQLRLHMTDPRFERSEQSSRGNYDSSSVPEAEEYLLTVKYSYHEEPSSSYPKKPVEPERPRGFSLNLLDISRPTTFDERVAALVVRVKEILVSIENGRGRHVANFSFGRSYVAEQAQTAANEHTLPFNSMDPDTWDARPGVIKQWHENKCDDVDALCVITCIEKDTLPLPGKFDHVDVADAFTLRLFQHFALQEEDARIRDTAQQGEKGAADGNPAVVYVMYRLGRKVITGHKRHFISPLLLETWSDCVFYVVQYI